MATYVRRCSCKHDLTSEHNKPVQILIEPNRADTRILKKKGSIGD